MIITLLTRSNHQFWNFHTFLNQFYVFFCYSRDEYEGVMIIDYNLAYQIQPAILNFHEIFNQFDIFLLSAVINMTEALLLSFSPIPKLWLSSFHKLFNQFYLNPYMITNLSGSADPITNYKSTNPELFSRIF